MTITLLIVGLTSFQDPFQYSNFVDCYHDDDIIPFFTQKPERGKKVASLIVKERERGERKKREGGETVESQLPTQENSSKSGSVE